MRANISSRSSWSTYVCCLERVDKQHSQSQPTFCPTPHGDAVSVIKADRQQDLSIAAEIERADANTVSTLQDGEGLLRVAVPDMNGRRLANLTWRVMNQHNLCETQDIHPSSPSPSPSSSPSPSPSPPLLSPSPSHALLLSLSRPLLPLTPPPLLPTTLPYLSSSPSPPLHLSSTLLPLSISVILPLPFHLPSPPSHHTLLQLFALTSGNDLAEFGISAARKTNNVIVVLKIERLLARESVVEHPRTCRVVEKRVVRCVREILASVETTIAKDEVEREVLRV